MNNSVLEDKIRERKLLDAFFDEDMLQWSKGMLHKYNKLMAYYRCAIMEVETKFNVLNEELSFNFSSVSSCGQFPKDETTLLFGSVRYDLPGFMGQIVYIINFCLTKGFVKIAAHR